MTESAEASKRSRIARSRGELSESIAELPTGRTRRPACWLAAVVAAAFVAAACGSTVPDDIAAVEPGLSDAAAPNADSSLGSVSDTTPIPGASSTGTAGSAPGAQPNSSTNEDATGTDGSAVAHTPGDVPFGKGVSATTINLGFFYQAGTDPSSACSALGGCSGGLAGGSTSDPKAFQKALVDYVNTHGGIAGRKVVPIFHGSRLEDRLTASGQDREDQAACSTFTEDNKVFAIMIAAGTDQDVLTECAVETETVIVESPAQCTNWQSEASLARRSPYYYVTNSLTTDRADRVMVESLARRTGFFARGEKVGVMVQDLPEMREGFERGMKPALQRLGVNVDSVVYYPHYLTSPWTNYVLQFQEAGIDRVIFSAATCTVWPALFFLRAAENQLYRPLYGISQTGKFLQDNAPKEQYVNVTGPQWYLGDQNSQGNCWNGQPCGPISPLDEVCRAISKSAGTAVAAGNTLCDDVFFLKAALDGASSLTPAGLKEAVAAMGSSWVSSATIRGATQFGPTRFSGAIFARNFVWSEANGRYELIGDTYTIL